MHAGLATLALSLWKTPASAYDELCWADGNGFSYQECCNPFALRGHSQCWQPPVYTFDRCCTPASTSTAVGLHMQLVIPAGGRGTSAVALAALRRLTQGNASSPWRSALTLPAWAAGPGAATVGVGERDLAAAAQAPQPAWAVVWRQRQLCPPAIADRGPDGESLEPSGPGSCQHPRLEDHFWVTVHETTHVALAFSQSAPGDPSLAPLFAAGIRFASAIRELWCVLRWWHCFALGMEGRTRLLEEVCAVIDLVLVQIAGGQEGHGFCTRWNSTREPLGRLVVEAMAPFFDDLDERLAKQWSTKRWTMVGGLKAHYGSPHHGKPLVAYQGGPGGSFMHFAAPTEFNPACEGIARRPADAPYYSAEGHALWVDSTGTLTWHLSILDVAEALLASHQDWVIVNLGAEDGGCHSAGQRFWMYDPANCLLEANPRAGGVVLEGNTTSLFTLRKRYAGKEHVLCVTDYTTPDSIRDAILAAKPCDGGLSGAKAAAVRESIAAGIVDFLKVDVDFGDCDFLEALVPHLRPRFVHAEMNPHYPPPFAQRQHFDAELASGGGGHPSDLPGVGGPAHWIRGCSLSGIAEALGGRTHYVLAQVEFDHALFVRADLARQVLPNWPRMEQLRLWDHWLASYHCHPLRHIAREDERTAGYDFRRFVPAGFWEGDAKAGAEAEAAMRELLIASGGIEMPPPLHQAAGLAARGARRGFPFSLKRCEACG